MRSAAGAVLALWALAFGLVPAMAGEESFWSATRAGANSFNMEESADHLASAKAFGASFVRMTFTKWKSRRRDFLIGDADDYRGLVGEDLAVLMRVLDGAAARGVKVVIAPLSLPGARWTQHNGDTPDLRLWRDRKWWTQAAAFWRDLAAALEGHPAVVGYNVINEPAPELTTGLSETAGAEERDRWCTAQKDTAADLDAFYRTMVAAIRSADSDTPIILDTGYYAQPMAIRCLAPIRDGGVLYAVHVYEPYDFTSRHNKGRYAYPGDIAYGGATGRWDRERLAAHLRPLLDWAAANGVAHSRLMVGEFGCYRRNAGCAAYLSDLVALFEEAGLHWAFYAYREDEWDGYDYELGAAPLPWSYWQARERGETPEPPRRETALSTVIRDGLARVRPAPR